MPYRRRRRRLRSTYCYDPIQPPFRYFLTPSETAAAIGIKPETLIRWRNQWLRDGVGDGPPPVKLSPKTFRYRRDWFFRHQPGEDYLTKSKQELWKSIAAETATPRIAPPPKRTATKKPSPTAAVTATRFRRLTRNTPVQELAHV